MARGINKVILVGNVGSKDSFDSGIRFSVATSESWKDKDSGEQKERTEWHKCVVFGRLADVMDVYMHVGSKVYVEGKLQTSSYDKEGVTMYTTQIIANTIELLDKKGQESEEPKKEDFKKPSYTPDQTPTLDNFLDDIPF